MKFKVGDKVRVRKDLEVSKKYGNYDVVEDMKKYKGKEFIINEVRRHCYRLKNENWYYWTDEMLELVEEGEKNNMELEKLNEEYKNKMDKLMEEYKDKIKEIEKKEEPFIKKGQGYFTIDGHFHILTTKNFDCEDDEERIQTGNCYPFTDENKEKVYREVNLIAERRKLQSEMEQFTRLNNDYKIDWSNTEQYKWSLYINYVKNEIMIDWTSNCRDLNNVYFTSEEIAEKALDKFKDRIRDLYLDVENNNN